MGRKSIKENKTRFQLSRENAGFTREGAAATLEFISADRIEKIENEKTDFLNIRNNLDDMALAIESLKLWIRNTID